MIKQNLIDFVCTGDIPNIISQIKDLSKDPEFIEVLYSKFSEKMLIGYGFSRDVSNRTPMRQAHHSPNTSALHNQQHSTSQTKHAHKQ